MTAAASPSYRLRLLGAPQLQDATGQTPPSLGWGKPLGLLCYLAVRGEARRDEVVDLLWRDVEGARARNAFRQALHRLRTALGDDLVPKDRDRLRLGSSDRLAIDIVEFDRLVDAGRLDDAVALYAGDFLEGAELGEPAFDHWAEQERTRLRARFRQVLQDTVHDATTRGRWAEAIAHAKHLQRLVPFEADAARVAATTMVSAGRRIEALELLRAFAQRTERELGIAVDADVQALIASLSKESSLGARTPTSATPAGIRSLPFVGREAELSQLLGLWQTVGEDAGALALIAGEAGIGKTRLATEFCATARALGSTLVLSGRERAAGAQLPYGIFGEALRPLVRAPGVAGASAHLLAEAARLLPEMRDSFDLPPVSAVDDEASRLRFFEGVAALIDAAAYEQRTLIVLEELQHVPPSSLDLLSYLAARLAGAPVMFLLTVRPTDSSPAVLSRLHALAEADEDDASPLRGRARKLTLGPLVTEQTLDALRGATGSAEISPAILERIARHSAGNPLRALQALRSVSAGETLASSPVPLRDVLLERLARLSSTQRRVFLVLALLGRPATVQLLAAAAHVSESSCRDALRVIEEHGFVDCAGDDVRVANELAAEIALDVAGQAGRAFLSGWLADALAQQANADSAELARAYAAAGNGPLAFRHARRAAFDFLANGAQAEAAQLLAQARTFASSPSETAEIESALEALGSGRRRLPVGSVGASQPQASVDDAHVRSGERSETPTPRASVAQPVAIAWWERLFPNWRILFGAALATLVISAVVLNDRTPGLATAFARSVDTLLVDEDPGDAAVSPRMAIGNMRTGFVLGPRVDRAASNPAWVDSIPRGWTNALPSPNGLRVALSRLTPTGMDLLVVGRDRRDSITLLANQPHAAPLGWSPDGSWLLAVRGRPGAGSVVSSLIAFRVIGVPAAVPIDTLPRHAIAEALWSPDGVHIAWVARAGPERQLEVFTSLADGSDVRNVSRHPGEDYHIAWSPDGALLAFTSTRDGNPELYAADLVEDRLWRLTSSPAQDDRAAFSPDGRSLAFESTRGGSFGVYVIPALGGEPQVIDGQSPMELLSWRGSRAPFVDHVRIDAADLNVGDSLPLQVRAFAVTGDSIAAQRVEWRVLDTALVRFVSADDVSQPTRTLLGLRPGLARVAAVVGRWRSDTAFVRVGSSRIQLLDGDLADERGWRLLGAPAPLLSRVSGQPAVLLRAGRDWQSGFLSRRTVPVVPGLTISVVLRAPWDDAPDAATEATLALVAPEDDAAIDSMAPQFLRLASVTWKAEAGRFIFAVGREIFTEPVDSVSVGARKLELRVEEDSTVTFRVDAQPRWRSTVRLAAPRSRARGQIWIGARATADQVHIASVSVSLAARAPERAPEN